MTDQNLINLVKKIAVNDAKNSADDFSDLEDKEELYDIADDAWYHSGYIYLQEDESLEDLEGLEEKIEQLKLNALYNRTFMDAIIKKYDLKF